jgi:hypothetical protein
LSQQPLHSRERAGIIINDVDDISMWQGDILGLSADSALRVRYELVSTRYMVSQFHAFL